MYLIVYHRTDTSIRLNISPLIMLRPQPYSIRQIFIVCSWERGQVLSPDGKQSPLSTLRKYIFVRQTVQVHTIYFVDLCFYRLAGKWGYGKLSYSNYHRNYRNCCMRSMCVPFCILWDIFPKRSLYCRRQTIFWVSLFTVLMVLSIPWPVGSFLVRCIFPELISKWNPSSSRNGTKQSISVSVIYSSRGLNYGTLEIDWVQRMRRKKCLPDLRFPNSVPRWRWQWWFALSYNQNPHLKSDGRVTVKAYLQWRIPFKWCSINRIFYCSCAHFAKKRIIMAKFQNPR